MKQLVLLSKEEYEGLMHYGVPGMKWGVRKEPETKGGSKGGGSNTKGSEKRRSMKDRVTAAAPYVKRLLVGGLLAYAGYKLGVDAEKGRAKEAAARKQAEEDKGTKFAIHMRNVRRQGIRNNIADHVRTKKMSEEDAIDQIKLLEDYATGRKPSSYGDLNYLLKGLDDWDATKYKYGIDA